VKSSKAGTLPAPGSGKQHQDDPQPASFGELQLSWVNDVISTIALVPYAAGAGSAALATSSGSSSEKPPCVLWVCYGKRTECYPSWAPTQKTQLDQADKVKQTRISRLSNCIKVA